jgi:putative hydrolase of the HAD superfamily
MVQPRHFFITRDMTGIRAILFDLDGVVRRWDWGGESALEAAHNLAPNAFWTIAFEPSLLRRAVRGEITDEQWRDEVRRVVEKAHGREAAAIVDKWTAHFGEVDRDVLAIVGALRPMYRVGLLTNGTTRLDRDLEMLGIRGRFDEVINSAATGVEKPTREAYLNAAKKMGFDVGECLLIDDTEKHVTGAIEAGMRAIRFVDPGQLRAELHKHGIRI